MSVLQSQPRSGSSRPAKPRLCIAMPGINYTPQSPYVLSTLPMVPYLAEDFEITVAYRQIVDPEGLDAYAHETLIRPEQQSAWERNNRHGYYAPQNYVQLWRYRQQLNEYAVANAHRFDLILEKEWPLLGLLSSAFAKQGVPSVLLAEAVYNFEAKAKAKPSSAPGLVSGGAAPSAGGDRPSLKTRLKSTARAGLGVGFDRARRQLRQRWGCKVDGIVAETRQLEFFLRKYHYARPDTPIYPIPYGVDLSKFQPADRDACRQELGLPRDRTLIVYVGSLNRFIQEPGPTFEALGREQPENVELHVVGDGNKRGELEALAHQVNAPITFHGRVPQAVAARYIGAADLCSAPYDTSLYPDELFTCASLKIPEYLACGRPVVATTCDRMDDLFMGDRYGYQVPNTLDGYRQFFRQMPSRAELHRRGDQVLQDFQAGILRDRNIVLTWQDIADLHQVAINTALSQARPLA